MTVGLVMTVGYYRLLNWAYCENGLENQNTAPFLSVHDQFPPLARTPKFKIQYAHPISLSYC